MRYDEHITNVNYVNSMEDPRRAGVVK
jgi:hypothetical protein